MIITHPPYDQPLEVFPPGSVIIWKEPLGKYATYFDYRLHYINGPLPKNHLVAPYSKGPTYYETPIEICRWILQNTHPEIVIDPYCGTGNILLAAKELSIPFFGKDIDPKAFQAAVHKLSSHQNKVVSWSNAIIGNESPS